MTRTITHSLALTLMALGISATALAANTNTSKAETVANTSATVLAADESTSNVETALANQEQVMDATKTSIDPNRFNSLRDYIFSDVAPNYWAAQSITTMAEAKILNGYSDGTFHPEQPLKREEAAIVFNNLIGERPGVMLASSYSDITSDRFSAMAIDNVSKKNIMSGYGDNSFKPEQYMSRQEFAVVADNYLHYVGYKTEDPTTLDDIAYADQKFIAPWAQDAVRELASLGFLAYNKDTLFNPEKYITRAEAAEITYRMTYTPQALKVKQDIENSKTLTQTVNIVNKTFDYKDDLTKIYEKGAIYWNKDGQLTVTMKDKKAAKALATKIQEDPVLQDKVLVINGKYSQADFDQFQDQASQLYQGLVKDGNIYQAIPNNTGDQLLIFANPVNPEATQAFQKKFGNKVSLQSYQADNSITWERPLTYNFGKDQRKLAPKA